MKRLLIILLLTPFTSFAQKDTAAYISDIRKAVSNLPQQTSSLDSAGVKVIAQRIVDSFKVKLDSVILKTTSTTTATPKNIDTLLIPVNTLQRIELTIKLKSGNLYATAEKIVTVVNKSGVITVLQDVDRSVMIGDLPLTNCRWSLVGFNGGVAVQVTGIASTSITWEIAKYKKL